MIRPLLLAGVIAPVIYVALAASGPLLAPGYDPATQMISELGVADLPRAAVFNIGLMLAGALTVLAGAGFWLALRRAGAGAIATGLAALAVAVFGVSIVIGGLFPLPDERHLGWGLGYAAQIAPLLMLVALWRVPGHAALKLFLGLNVIAVNAFLAIMFGVGDLVDGSNIGLWQRAYGLAVYPWIGVAALALLTSPRPSALRPARAF